MFKKILEFFKGTGKKFLIDSVPLAEPYLVEQIKKVEGKIGSTPEEQAKFVITHVQEFLKKKLGY